MKMFILRCVVFSAGALTSVQGAQTATFESAIVPVLKVACIQCHNNGLYSGGLNLENEFSTEKSLTSQREAWGRILKRMRAGQMPPPRMPRPEGLAGMIGFLERVLQAGDQTRQPE